MITAARFGIVWVAIWVINYKNYKIALPELLLSPFDTSSSLLLAMLKRVKLFLRCKKQKTLIMYKTMNLPQTIFNVFSLNAMLMNIT